MLFRSGRTAAPASYQQLFTIGLYELNPDGTLRRDASNNPIETYGQSDIANLARVFTGYDWDYLSNGGTFTDVAWHDYGQFTERLISFGLSLSFP